MPDFIVLADYDNVRLEKRERSQADVDSNLASLATAIAALLASEVSREDSIILRLYGGWITELGQYSQRGQWMLAGLQSARGLFSGVRMVPEVVTSLASRPSSHLIGLLRTQRTPLEQKMVDTLLAVDLVHFADQGQSVLLASDDDDMVPPLLHASQRAVSISLARRRNQGVGLNDGTCGLHGVRFLLLPEEYRK